MSKFELAIVSRLVGLLAITIVCTRLRFPNPKTQMLDKKSEVYTVRYDAVNAMLLNEFLKEHRRVEELQATVAKQAKQIEALMAQLERMNARLDMSQSAPQTVLNSQ